ncbi:MAG: tyrosine recombinase XerC [Eubacteriales bacterium]|nr:tyrosine recombinase XerC [Eubacteriales bacterium]
MQDVPLFERLEQFLGYFQAIRERSPQTIREYRYDLVLFFRFMLNHRGQTAADSPFNQIRIDQIDDDFLRSVSLTDLYAYMTWLSRERHNAPPTRARKVSALRSFFGYLKQKANVISEDPTAGLESPKQIRRLPRYLSLEESKQLLAAADQPEDDLSARDYCILTLFLNCGMRLSELCSIQLPDWRGDVLTVVGKGGKERTIYLNGACLDALEKHMEQRPKTGLKDPQALFVSNRGTQISPKTVQYLIKRYIKAAGLDPRRYSTHKLRHTAATLMYQYGKVDIRALQMILGHASISTTEIYTHVNSDSLHQAVENNPLNEIRSR